MRATRSRAVFIDTNACRFVPTRWRSIPPGGARARRRENVGDLGGASQDRAGATAEPGRRPDPAGHEGVRLAADRK